MRVKLEGRLDRELLAALLERVVEELADSYGVEMFSAVNLYFTPRDQDGRLLELHDSEGDELGGLIYHEPKTQRRPRRSRRPRLVVLEGGRSGAGMETDQAPDQAAPDTP